MSSSGSACRFWSFAGTSSVTVPPSGRPRSASAFLAMRFVTIAPERTWYRSAVTRPETSASPIPKLASMETVSRRPVIGSAVNMIPETSGRTIRWTTTERSTERCGKPFVAR